MTLYYSQKKKYNYTQIKQYFDGFNKIFFVILTQKKNYPLYLVYKTSSYFSKSLPLQFAKKMFHEKLFYS